MKWTIEYFKYQQRQWKDRQDRVEIVDERSAGLTAYAAKQAALWRDFASTGTLQFKAKITDLQL